jgi:hypothetical protein
MDPDEARDAAADAFEDLRDEVAELRATLAEFPNRVRIRTPDYTPSLAAIQKTLETIEQHPALQHSPQSYVQEARAMTEGIRQKVEPQLREATNAVQRASAEVSRFAGDLRSRQAQGKALAYAAGAGFVVGAILWGIAAGPLARTLPASWRIPERMAVAVFDQDRWDAGWRLLQFANPGSASDLDQASRVWNVNQEVLKSCLRKAAEQHEPEPCKITVSPAAAD